MRGMTRIGRGILQHRIKGRRNRLGLHQAGKDGTVVNVAPQLFRPGRLSPVTPRGDGIKIVSEAYVHDTL